MNVTVAQLAALQRQQVRLLLLACCSCAGKHDGPAMCPLDAHDGALYWKVMHAAAAVLRHQDNTLLTL